MTLIDNQPRATQNFTFFKMAASLQLVTFPAWKNWNSAWPEVGYRLGSHEGHLFQISCFYHKLWINHEQMYIYAIYRRPCWKMLPYWNLMLFFISLGRNNFRTYSVIPKWGANQSFIGPSNCHSKKHIGPMQAGGHLEKCGILHFFTLTVKGGSRTFCSVLISPSPSPPPICLACLVRRLALIPGRDSDHASVSHYLHPRRM